jgi:hypothetical protein
MRINRIFFVLIIILFPLAVLAEELVLPFHLDIRAENEAKEARLIFNYGRDAFNNCAKGTDVDKLNPYLYAKLLRESEYCLQGLETAIANCINNKIDSAGTCITIDVGCKERYGEFSYATGKTLENNNECQCVAGYVWNEDRSECIAPCPEDMVFYSPYRDSENNILQPFCKSLDQACQEEFGEYSQYSSIDNYGRVKCACIENSVFTENVCTEPIIVAGFESSEADINYAITIEREQSLSLNFDINLSERLSGRILLQVEERGEAWYVNPDDKYRYYLASPSKAFEVMRSLGLGVNHEFLSSYEYYPSHVWGKILIDVDDFGKAYYINSVDKKAYYLGTPDMAFEVMRELGLGVSNEDLRKIFVTN